MLADHLSSPPRQSLTPMKGAFSVPNDHMDEGDVVEGGSLCGGGAMKEGSVTQRKWIRKGYRVQGLCIK